MRKMRQAMRDGAADMNRAYSDSTKSGRPPPNPACHLYPLPTLPPNLSVDTHLELPPTTTERPRYHSRIPSPSILISVPPLHFLRKTHDSRARLPTPIPIPLPAPFLFFAS